MLLILIFSLLFKASGSTLTVSGSTHAEYGGEANYECKLDSQSDVLQVTWQRIKDGSPENIATYSERFGSNINSPYAEKVIFKQASLSFTAITIRNITWDDEGCYICSFNAYPGGSQTKQICLTVQGISKVNTSSTEIDSREKEDHQLFGCSATGKPAPKITWSSSFPHNNQTHTTRNDDNTFTITSIITLPRPTGGKGHVDCLLNVGTQSERRERIYFLEKEEKTEQARPSFRVDIFIIISVLTVAFFIFIIIFAQNRLKKRAPENNCTI